MSTGHNNGSIVDKFEDFAN
jgi:hypothetical protein